MQTEAGRISQISRQIRVTSFPSLPFPFKKAEKKRETPNATSCIDHDKIKQSTQPFSA
jgi:hypothetical protein